MTMIEVIFRSEPFNLFSGLLLKKLSETIPGLPLNAKITRRELKGLQWLEIGHSEWNYYPKTYSDRYIRTIDSYKVYSFDISLDNKKYILYFAYQTRENVLSYDIEVVWVK